MRLDLTMYVAAGAVLLSGLLGAILMYAKRRKPQAAPGRGEENGAPAWTILTAAVATAVSADGMWQTFNGMEMPLLLRFATFAFLELMVLQSAIRARQAMRKNTSPGIDGIAMWFWTLVSALLSASHEASGDNPDHVIVAVRFIAPLAAAWGWERSMALERKLRTGESLKKIHWRISPERILVRLGLAESTDRTVVDVDAHRRITRLARAAKRLRLLQQTGAAAWRIRRASRTVDQALERAVEHAGLATDADRQQLLMSILGVLNGADSLASSTPPAPWTTAAFGQQPSTTETVVRGLADVGALDLDNRTRATLGLPPLPPRPRPALPVVGEPTATRQPTTRRSTDATTTAADDARPTTPTASDDDGRRRPTATAGDGDDPATAASGADGGATTTPSVDTSPTTTKPTRATTVAADGRRSTNDWAALTSSTYWALHREHNRRPTALEFAAAVDAAGHGQLSETRAKEVRIAIERSPAPDAAPTTSDAPTGTTDDGPAINGAAVLIARP